MIEREFLFWVIVGTSLVSYSIGYFLWLFVHWYYDERPKTRTFKVYKDEGELSLELNTTRTLRLLDASGKNPPWPGKVLVRDLSWKRKADESIEVTVDFVTYKDPEVLVEKSEKQMTADEQLDLIFSTGYAEHAKQEGADWKAKQPPTDPKLPPAKTSGEPEKKREDKLPPVRSADPYWAVVDPNGHKVFIQKAKTSYEVFKAYAESCLHVSTLVLDARGYKVKPYTPTSPPPPPIEYFGNMFHPVKPIERKPNA